MWEEIRRAVTDVVWGRGGQEQRDALAEWAATVTVMADLERAMRGRVSDTMARVVSATGAATRAHREAPTVWTASLQPVRTAMAEAIPLVRDRGAAPTDQANLMQVAYELAHHVRVLHSASAHDWLARAENVLDAAVHTPVAPSRMASALTRWQDAVAAVERLRESPVVQRGVRLGHLRILRAAAQATKEMADAGALPADQAAQVREALREMAEAHRHDLPVLSRPGPDPRADAIRLRLGEAVASVRAALQSPERADVLLDAFLRSDFGVAPAVAGITGAPAREPAARLSELSWRYLVDRPSYRLPTPPVLSAGAAPAPAAAATQPTRAAHEDPDPHPDVVTPRVSPGDRFDRDTVRQLCRDRDAGKAAEQGQAGHPLVAGVPQDEWPRLIQAGRAAVADLCQVAIPIVHAAVRKRGERVSKDQLAFLMEWMVRAAHTYDPDSQGGMQWSTYVWQRTELLGRSLPDDSTGRRPDRPPKASLTSWDEMFEVEWKHEQQLPGPEDVLLSTHNLDQIADAVQRLPKSRRDPLIMSIQGATTEEVAERIGTSPGAVSQRLTRARHQVAQTLGHDPRRREIAR